MYEELQVEGYLVDYERVPVTDEKSPKELDFDILVGFHLLNFGLYLFQHFMVCICVRTRKYSVSPTLFSSTFDIS